MGFLAFLLIGGATGASTWILYPGGSKDPKKAGIQKFLGAILFGLIAALASSYLGQYLGLFQSGQILEWLSAILASCVIGCFYSALAK